MDDLAVTADRCEPIAATFASKDLAGVRNPLHALRSALERFEHRQRKEPVGSDQVRAQQVGTPVDAAPGRATKTLKGSRRVSLVDLFIRHRTVERLALFVLDAYFQYCAVHCVRLIVK